MAATITVAPSFSGNVYFYGFPTAVQPATPTPALAGMSLIYYRPTSQHAITLANATDVTGLLYDNTHIASLSIMNRVTGVVLSSGALTFVSNGNWYYANWPVTGFSFVHVLRLSISIADSMMNIVSTYEVLALPLPQLDLQYHQISTNRLVVAGLIGPDGLLRTSANTSVYLTLKDKYAGTTLLAQSACAYDGIGAWHYDAPEFAAEPVVAVTVDVYDQTGSGGTHYAQFLYTAHRGQ